MHIIFPFAALLKNLDLQYTFLSTEDHCELIQRCPSLEILKVPTILFFCIILIELGHPLIIVSYLWYVRNVIGDRRSEVVAYRCKRLRRLRIERGKDEQGMEDEQGTVSHIGSLLYPRLPGTGVSGCLCL